MKNYLFSIYLILLISCNNSKKEELNPTIKTSIPEQKKCIKGTPFGDIEVCIPTIKRYKDIYNKEHLEMMELLDSNEYDLNQIIGYYVNDISYQNEDYKTFNDTDYFKIYSVKNYKNKYSTSSDLLRLYNIQQEGFIKENWDYVNEKYEQAQKDVSIDRPIILESYKTNDDFLTVIFLMKYNLENEEKFMLGAMNFLLIKNRIIHYGYYLNYNEENVKKIKQKNNYIGLKILDENI